MAPPPPSKEGSPEPPRQTLLDALADANKTFKSEHPSTRRAGSSIPSQKLPSPHPSFSIYELICGCLMLLTVILPWMSIGGRTLMSWDLLSNVPSSATAFVMFVVGSWIIGLAAIILSALLRGLPAAASHAGLGLLSIVLFAVMSASASRGMPDVSLLDIGILGALRLLALVGVIVTTGLRLRLPPDQPLRVCQGVLSGIHVALFIVWLIQSLTSFSKLPSYVRKELIGDHIFLILIHLAVASGAVLSLIHAALGEQRRKTLPMVTLGIVYGAVPCLAAYFIIRPAVGVEQPGLALFVLNLCLLVIPALFLLCNGLINGIWWLASALPQPRARSLPSRARAAAGSYVELPRARETPARARDESGIPERLRQLEALLAESLITEQEYEIRRDRILNEV